MNAATFTLVDGLRFIWKSKVPTIVGAGTCLAAAVIFLYLTPATYRVITQFKPAVSFQNEQLQTLGLAFDKINEAEIDKSDAVSIVEAKPTENVFFTSTKDALTTEFFGQISSHSIWSKAMLSAGFSDASLSVHLDNLKVRAGQTPDVLQLVQITSNPVGWKSATELAKKLASENVRSEISSKFRMRYQAVERRREAAISKLKQEYKVKRAANGLELQLELQHVKNMLELAKAADIKDFDVYSYQKFNNQQSYMRTPSTNSRYYFFRGTQLLAKEIEIIERMLGGDYLDPNMIAFNTQLESLQIRNDLDLANTYFETSGYGKKGNVKSSDIVVSNTFVRPSRNHAIVYLGAIFLGAFLGLTWASLRHFFKTSS